MARDYATIVLCEAAASYLSGFEERVLALNSLIQQLAQSCGQERATIKTLHLVYHRVRVAPYYSCIRAAALWLLDCPPDVVSVIDISLVHPQCQPLPERDCVDIAKKECWAARCEQLGNLEATDLVFLPYEYVHEYPSAYRLFHSEDLIPRARVEEVLRAVEDTFRSEVARMLV